LSRAGKEVGARIDSLQAFQIQGRVFWFEKDIGGEVLVAMEEYLPLRTVSTHNT